MVYLQERIRNQHASLVTAKSSFISGVVRLAADATSHDIVHDQEPGCSMGAVAPVRVQVVALAWCYYRGRGADVGSFCRRRQTAGRVGGCSGTPPWSFFRTGIRLVGWVVAQKPLAWSGFYRWFRCEVEAKLRRLALQILHLTLPIPRLIFR